MFGKALRLAPRCSLLDEPTQGIDVGAKDQIHSLVDEAAAEGVATLVASTDTDELVRLCHRVIVLADGRDRRHARGRPRSRTERSNTHNSRPRGRAS